MRLSVASTLLHNEIVHVSPLAMEHNGVLWNEATKQPSNQATKQPPFGNRVFAERILHAKLAGILSSNGLTQEA